MKKIVILLSFFFSFTAAFGQITVNTNFAVNGNLPIDARDTLTTLADTAFVTWTYPGLLSYAVDVDQYWYYNSSYWKQLGSGSDLSSLPAATSITSSEKLVMVDSLIEFGQVLNQIKDSISFDRTATTGTNVDFAIPTVYGTEASPITTSPITVDLTDGKFFQQIMFHQSNVPPTFNSGNYEVSGVYWSGKMNMLTFEYVSPTRYNIRINQ